MCTALLTPSACSNLFHIFRVVFCLLQLNYKLTPKKWKFCRTQQFRMWKPQVSTPHLGLLNHRVWCDNAHLSWNWMPCTLSVGGWRTDCNVQIRLPNAVKQFYGAHIYFISHSIVHRIAYRTSSISSNTPWVKKWHVPGKKWKKYGVERTREKISTPDFLNDRSVHRFSFCVSHSISFSLLLFCLYPTMEGNCLCNNTKRKKTFAQSEKFLKS